MDGTPVTATVGNGGLTPSDPGAVEEWLSFNASVRRAGERKGYLSSSSKGGLEQGRDDLPARGQVRYPRARRRRGARSTVSIGALERGGDHPASPRGVRMGRMLGFFESFLFSRLEGGCMLSWAQLLNMCLHFSE